MANCEIEDAVSKIIALCDKIDSYINDAVNARIKEESLADVKEQATEAAILTACFEFKRFCDMVESGAGINETVFESFSKNKEYWIKDFEHSIRDRLQQKQSKI
nr:MAG TPA: hypothetical protein [Caudoviricetes sp.]